MTITEFIKQEMAARGMSYEQLAADVGMSKQNLWDKLNKRTQPNFGNVRKILAGLDYEIVIEKKVNGVEPAQMDLGQFFEITEIEQVSYECIVGLLSTIGYELKIETHKNEKKVKKGIDTF